MADIAARTPCDSDFPLREVVGRLLILLRTCLMGGCWDGILEASGNAISARETAAACAVNDGERLKDEGAGWGFADEDGCFLDEAAGLGPFPEATGVVEAEEAAVSLRLAFMAFSASLWGTLARRFLNQRMTLCGGMVILAASSCSSALVGEGLSSKRAMSCLSCSGLAL